LPIDATGGTLVQSGATCPGEEGETSPCSLNFGGISSCGFSGRPLEVPETKTFDEREEPRGLLGCCKDNDSRCALEIVELWQSSLGIVTTFPARGEVFVPVAAFSTPPNGAVEDFISMLRSTRVCSSKPPCTLTSRLAWGTSAWWNKFCCRDRTYGDSRFLATGLDHTRGLSPSFWFPARHCRFRLEALGNKRM
jgi:hypothetical protein